MVVFVSDAWCGIVNVSQAEQGDNVTVGCYGQYDWLGYWLQYNPVASIQSSIQFLQDARTHRTLSPDLQDAIRPPASEVLITTYTVQNVKPGDMIDATCQIDFKFDARYSSRHTYASNALQWNCSVHHPFHREYRLLINKKVKLAHTRLQSVGFRSLAVSLQVM